MFGNASSGSSNNEIVTGMDPKFYRAAMKGDIDSFKEQGEGIEFILTPNKNTILHIHLTNYGVSEAFVQGILHLCPTLFMKANAKGESILHIAARYGHSRIVRILIQHDKGLIRVTNNGKDTALHEAMRFHHTKIVDILTKEDPDFTYSGNSDGETPLYIAVEKAYSDVALKILQNCNEPSQDGPNGRTALHAAILRNEKEVVPKLLTMSSAGKGDENGWVALHWAALHSDPDLAEELLKYDRNMAYMRDKKGRTALHLAAYRGNVRTVEMIIKYCPDCSELVDEQGYNVLHYTVVSQCGSAKNVARVILKNASLSNLYNEKDAIGNTPLHLTAKFQKDHHLLHLLKVLARGALLKTLLHRIARHCKCAPLHPLLISHPRVDPLAFNIQNQTVVDVAYDEVCRPSSSIQEPDFFSLQKIGASYGGRVINKDARKKEQEQRHDHSAVDTEEKQEKRDKSSTLDRLRDANFIVATLNATVTFQAAISVPGGTIQDGQHQGTPILKDNPSFIVFALANTISFWFSTCAVLFQIASSLALRNHYIYKRLIGSALVFTMWALVSMVIAFYAGVSALMGYTIPTGFINGLLFIYMCYALFRMVSKPVAAIPFVRHLNMLEALYSTV